MMKSAGHRELMGGVEPARTYIVEALETGKQVVTANRMAGKEIPDTAENNGCGISLSCVAGAIDIIRPLKQSLAGSMLTEVMGIVSRTTNYILTKMSEEGMWIIRKRSRRRRGTATRRRITADVEGYDAGERSRLPGIQLQVTFKDVYMEGITRSPPMTSAMQRNKLCDQTSPVSQSW